MLPLKSYVERYGNSDGFLLLRGGKENTFLIFQEPIDSLKLSFNSTVEPSVFLQQIRAFIDDQTYVAGYFCYEFLHVLENIPFVKNATSKVPTVTLYKYTDIIECPAEKFLLNTPETKTEDLKLLQTEIDNYKFKVASIMESIRNGDVYQVNLSRRIYAAKSLSPLKAVSFLTQFTSAKYGAFGTVHGDEIFSYLSFSPELFFRRDNNKITTSPIKGTSFKTGDHKHDLTVLSELISSSKDRAELAMIVDLYRNDLGKFAMPGSVEVGEFPLWLETDSLFHLYSAITCLVSDTTSSFEIFCSLFPSGSITGAPKIAAMEHISKLEEFPRNIYCGAIGYFGPKNIAEWNVAIRTVIARNGELDYRTGGGITIDSDESKEFQETEDKSQIFYKLINSL